MALAVAITLGILVAFAAYFVLAVLEEPLDEPEVGLARALYRVEAERVVDAWIDLGVEAGLELAVNFPAIDDAIFRLREARDHLREALGLDPL